MTFFKERQQHRHAFVLLFFSAKIAGNRDRDQDKTSNKVCQPRCHPKDASDGRFPLYALTINILLFQINEVLTFEHLSACV